MFDASFYARTNPGLATSESELDAHYLHTGWRQYRDPCPAFSTSLYLRAYPDVAASGLNPLVHYLLYGKYEKRKIQPSQLEEGVRASGKHDDRLEEIALQLAFDARYYLGKYPDVAATNTDPFTHYMSVGWREAKDPSPAFSTQYYLDSNQDIRDSGLNPFRHYVLWGKAEGRRGHPLEISADSARAREMIAPKFDTAYYLAQRGTPLIEDPVLDYLEIGWRLGLDPCPTFSTSYYLRENADVRAGGVNPFVHFVQYGINEHRRYLPFSRRVQLKPYAPLVSVIVPNYNHARFLRQRIESILSQSYGNFEVIFLDDRSTDDSLKVVRPFRKDQRFRVMENKANSGNVFAQWRKGIEAARGDLVWICESDDFCEPDFLARLVPEFADDSVMVAFGRIQFAGDDGKHCAGLDEYRESAEPGIWSGRVLRPAAQWFRSAFAVANVIPNVGGCVFRNHPVDRAVWDRLLRYTVVGDWFWYAMISAGGQIAYVPEAAAYFRQHGKNTSVKSFQGAAYYQEHQSVMLELRKLWEPDDAIVSRFAQRVVAQYEYAKARSKIGPLQKHFREDELLATRRKVRHILVAFLGFRVGGGELFPLHLANELVARGYLVSMLSLECEGENAEIRKRLDSRIPVYDAQYVKEVGGNEFLQRAGVDLVHSHTAAVEFFLFKELSIGKPAIPYVSTLHGSYEVTPVPDDVLMKIVRGVSHWIYLSRKNLGHLDGIPLSESVLSQIPNGFPKDERDAAVSRASLRIGARDVVFAIASRALREKGWDVAIAALAQAQRQTSVKLHLLLCGDGEEYDRLSQERLPRNVHLLGFTDRVNGVFRFADVVLLPSRFPGESHPLCLIQALQEGKPIIATDIGEIHTMIASDDGAAGILLPNLAADEEFTGELRDAMLAMVDRARRARFARRAAALAGNFDMAACATRYVAVYESVLAQARVLQ
jgi:glycosyltransferase involved in cell wall biosynthesis